MLNDVVYVLTTYAFYEADDILMISKKYSKVKECFDSLDKRINHGYVIKIYELDKGYLKWNDNGETLLHIEINSDGAIKDLCSL